MDDDSPLISDMVLLARSDASMLTSAVGKKAMPNASLDCGSMGGSINSPPASAADDAFVAGSCRVVVAALVILYWG